jgi:hypothetical protein
MFPEWSKEDAIEAVITNKMPDLLVNAKKNMEKDLVQAMRTYGADSKEYKAAVTKYANFTKALKEKTGPLDIIQSNWGMYSELFKDDPKGLMELLKGSAIEAAVPGLYKETVKQKGKAAGDTLKDAARLSTIEKNKAQIEAIQQEGERREDPARVKIWKAAGVMKEDYSGENMAVESVDEKVASNEKLGPAEASARAKYTLGANALANKYSKDKKLRTAVGKLSFDESKLIEYALSSKTDIDKVLRVILEKRGSSSLEGLAGGH